MLRTKRAPEIQLCEVDLAGEWRRVSCIAGDACTVLELSQGPNTELAYGCARHCHKIVCEWEACARALGVAAQQVQEALTELFAGEEPALLSDLMDLLDCAEQRYAYMAWDATGYATLRPSGYLQVAS